MKKEMRQRDEKCIGSKLLEQFRFETLLDKINEVGYAGLSKHEKERLDLLAGK